MGEQSRFEIYKSMRAGVTKPYRIFETTQTFDGPRTRIVDGTWASWKEAADHVRKVDPFVQASHELSLYMKSTKVVLYREEFYGDDVGASARLAEMWNDKTPANGSGYQATARRYGEQKPFDTIG